MKNLTTGVGLALCILFAAIGRAEASLKLRAQVTGIDVLARPGEPVLLQAKVALATPMWIHPSVHGQRVDFYYPNGALIGSARTAGEAIASLPFRPAAIGYTVVIARVVSPWLAGNDARIVIGNFSAATRFIVSDVDHTLARTHELSFYFTSNPADTAPLPYSAEVLRRAAARGFKIIYLTGRDHRFAVKSKAWLALYGYPTGCSFFMDQNITNVMNVEGYKEDTIRELRRRFPGIQIGVGDLETDAEAYRANGLRTIILPSQPGPTFPAGTIVVKNWLQAERFLR